mmetsp:Transcript_85926/g.192133  ORF Transcript_85926/g.192133 Transcript_85926/m.192133 type:complete len:222 (-) Transcript_85926:543-1208(-)
MTANVAAFASATVAALVAFSSSLSAVAFFLEASISAISSPRSLISCPNFAINAEKSSTCEVRLSTSAPRFSRDFLFVANSESHQALWSASSLASSMSRTSKSLIIFRTFPNGSSETLLAIVAKKVLPARLACSRNNEAARACAGALPAASLPCSWTKARGREAAISSNEEPGKCLSAAPATSGLERISVAFCKASNSCDRNTWRASNSLDFNWQPALRSRR